MPIPIEDDEVLLRRIPVSKDWCTQGNVLPDAFAPSKRDLTGISVNRLKYKTIEDAAKGASKMGYYVVEIFVRDLRALGIEVVPRPQLENGYDEAHAELPELRYDARKETITLERKEMLSKICRKIHGPFRIVE